MDIYKSMDNVQEPNKSIYHNGGKVKNADKWGGNLYSPEHLHKLNPSDLPPHELKLKVNTIVILLRNLSTKDGLCNGTRLKVLEMKKNVILAKILTGIFKIYIIFIIFVLGEKAGEIQMLWRIKLSSEDEKLPVKLERHQFPIKPAFAMTINKAQGQTYEYVGVDLRREIFDHGQLYVALSRAKAFGRLKVRDFYIIIYN